MALNAKLQFKLNQSLVMTPQLMQSIKLLQLSNVELADYVERELEKNPILELAGSDLPEERRGASSNIEEVRSDLGDPSSINKDVRSDLAADQTANSVEENFDRSLENVYDKGTGSDGNIATIDNVATDPWRNASQGSGSFDRDAADLEAFVAETSSLSDHLLRQIGFNFKTAADVGIAHEIVSSLDEDGYLRRPVDDLANYLGTTSERVNEVLEKIQKFDPAGIAARSLQECLQVQLEEKNRFDPAMNRLLNNLDLLAKRDFPALRKKCDVEHDDLIDMIHEIRELDPRPGLQFDNTPVANITADVIISTRSDGGWHVELNQDTLPKVLVNRTYYAQVEKSLKDETEKTFMVDCLQSANWLVKSLDQRAQTILKVTTEIVRQQDMFLTHGVEYLKPMNLKSVAEAIEMHESTISRVTSNKYVMTPSGLFELKYFFTASISATGGEEAHSAEAVRHRIRTLIDAETAETVLSDDAIVSKLHSDGIDIARRTVAKYREAMHIPSSVQRRRELRSMGGSKLAG